MENVEYGKCGVWKIWSMENVEYGKCGVWKMWSMENAEYSLFTISKQRANILTERTITANK